MPLSPGDILADHYRIEAEVGRGSYGRVYRAAETRLNVVRAIKEVAEGIDDLPASLFAEHVRRFEREARIQAAFNHPNIVHVYELLRLGDDRFYLVMEYVDGENLRDYLSRRGPLPIDEVVRIAGDLLAGLAVVHADPRDIVHRDVKPSNVLLTKDGHAKLTDFGLAQVGDASVRQVGTGEPHPGSPLYMSPEQETASDYLYPASDIFSAGCVLFEMLTGMPYKRAKKERKGLVELRPDAPSWLAETVAAMLAPNMESRPADAGKLAQLLSNGHAKAQAEARTKLEAEERERAAAQAKQEEEAAKRERQKQLLGLYLGLTADLRAKRWAEAIQKTDEILAIDRDYRDVARLRPRAEGKLRSEQEKAQREQRKAKTGPRPWRLLLLGAASVLAAAALLGVLAVPQQAPLHAWLFGVTPISTVESTPVPADTPAPVVQITPAAPDTATTSPSSKPTITATATALSTLTDTPTPTPTETVTPTITPTPKPAFTVNQPSVNVRAGPGTVYPILGQLHQGERYEITGRNEAGNWWQFDFEGKSSWISNEVVDVHGPVSNLSVVATPAAPTVTPFVARTQDASTPTPNPKYRPPELITADWSHFLKNDENWSLEWKPVGSLESDEFYGVAIDQPGVKYHPSAVVTLMLAKEPKFTCEIVLARPDLPDSSQRVCRGAGRIVYWGGPYEWYVYVVRVTRSPSYEGIWCTSDWCQFLSDRSEVRYFRWGK